MNWINCNSEVGSTNITPANANTKNVMELLKENPKNKTLKLEEYAKNYRGTYYNQGDNEDQFENIMKPLDSSSIELDTSKLQNQKTDIP